MNYKIADIPVMLTGDCLAEARSLMAEYRATEPQEGGIRISCREAKFIPAVEADTVYGVRNHIEEYGCADGNLLSQDRSGGQSYATVRYNADFSRAECTLTDIAPLGGADTARRMSVAVGKAFLNCLPAFDGVTYHASCISYRGKALLFCAPSGVGKSTHTALWKELFPDEVRYINDDTPVLREKEGVFHAYGAPWAGTSGVNENRSAPVGAIVYLERAETNRLTELALKEKILCAMRSARVQFFPQQRERQTRFLFRLANSSVPFFRLSCTPSPEAVFIVHSRLFPA